MRPVVSVSAGASKKVPPVTGVTVGAGTAANKVLVSWTPPEASLHTGIKVEASIDGGAYSTVATLLTSATSYEDTPGYSVDAQYKVTALRSTGVDADPVTSSTQRTLPAAPAPQGLSATNPGTITFTCNSPGGAKVDGFDVQLSTDDGGSWGATVDTGADPSHVFTGVGHGLTCRVRCRQRDTLGQTSAWAQWATAVVSANDTTGPTVPTPTASWSGTGMQVTWTAATDATSAVASLAIEVNYNGTGWVGAGYSQANGNAGTTNIATPDANRGHTVQFRLVVTDTYGNSTTGSASTIAYTKPKGTFYLLASSSDTYHAGSGAGWYGSGGTTYHGSGDPGSGVQTGCWFYGTQIADTCKGFAPDSGTIYMKRKGSAGSTGYNHIQPHSHASKPGGAPTLVSVEDSGPYLSGSDASASYGLPAAHLTAMGSGTAVGMATVDSGSWRGLYKLTDNSDEGKLTLVFS